MSACVILPLRAQVCVYIHMYICVCVYIYIYVGLRSLLATPVLRYMTGQIICVDGGSSLVF